MFGLKFRGEADLSVFTLRPSLNACMYLSGVVHWFASFLHLLPPVALLVYWFNRRAMAVGKSGRPYCLCVSGWCVRRRCRECGGSA